MNSELGTMNSELGTMNSELGTRNSQPRTSGGRLIVFEGIDGSGKSTQARRVDEALGREGIAHVLLREPTDGIYGARLRALFAAGRDTISREEECELYLRDRMDDVQRNIHPALGRGEVVLLDRYYFSTMAYQGALGLDVEKIRSDNEAIAPAPALALYFDLAPELALERITHHRGEEPNQYEKLDYLRRVRAIYQKMIFPYWRLIDASQSEEAVFQTVWREIQRLLEAL
ncbi:MAG: dTMP kinase [Candidatus Sumerlaeota bacterium]|nr:dTMP kinase [Candidatus Sumerlaeota bacterium]